MHPCCMHRTKEEERYPDAVLLIPHFTSHDSLTAPYPARWMTEDMPGSRSNMQSISGQSNYVSPLESEAQADAGSLRYPRRDPDLGIAQIVDDSD